MKEEFAPRRPLINAAILFSCVIGLLYFVGYVYRAKFLSEFYLDSNVFTRSTEQILVDGFALLNLMMKKQFWGSLFLFAIVFWGIIAFAKLNGFIRKKKTFLGSAWDYMFIIVVVRFLSLILGASWKFALKQGEEEAKEVRQKIDKARIDKIESGRFAKGLILYDGAEGKTPKQLKGHVVANSPNGVGVYADGTVYFIPMSRLIRVSGSLP